MYLFEICFDFIHVPGFSGMPECSRECSMILIISTACGNTDTVKSHFLDCATNCINN